MVHGVPELTLIPCGGFRILWHFGHIENWILPFFFFLSLRHLFFLEKHPRIKAEIPPLALLDPYQCRVLTSDPLSNEIIVVFIKSQSWIYFFFPLQVPHRGYVSRVFGKSDSGSCSVFGPDPLSDILSLLFLVFPFAWCDFWAPLHFRGKCAVGFDPITGNSSSHWQCLGSLI